MAIRPSDSLIHRSSPPRYVIELLCLAPPAPPSLTCKHMQMEPFLIKVSSTSLCLCLLSVSHWLNLLEELPVSSSNPSTQLLTKADGVSTVPTMIRGDWVLFHPVYTPEELKAVEVCCSLFEGLSVQTFVHFSSGFAPRGQNIVG
jgi:hypothetical protein